MSILTAEYDFDTAMAVKQEEAYAEGISIGLATGREEGISIGLERGAYETKLETAQTFLSMGLSPEQVTQGTNLPMDVVQGLLATADQ